MKKYLFIMLVIPVLLCSCGSSKETEKKQEVQYKTTLSGLKYLDIDPGEGAVPQRGQRVYVHQIVSIGDEEIENTYDKDQPFNFVIGNSETIAGLEEGVSTMKVGGKRLLYVPPELGFGRRAIRGIPKNSTIVIEVELLKVE